MFFDDKSMKLTIFFHTECWKENPEERPQMSKVVKILSQSVIDNLIGNIIINLLLHLLLLLQYKIFII